jgi:hypothetical protein
MRIIKVEDIKVLGNVGVDGRIILKLILKR